MCIQLENISKAYQRQVIFDGCDLSIVHNGLYFISGKSGCGKTTLLHIIAGYEGFDSGKRYVSENIKMTMLFQNFELINDLTVEENIFLYNHLYHIDNDDQMMIKHLGLQHLLKCYPKELSHGQKQRVALARALMTYADVYLCDEPTESLDKNNKEIVMELLQKLSKECIVIVVSHDEKLMEQYSDVQYHIENHKLVLKKEELIHNVHQVISLNTYHLKDVIKIMNSLILGRKTSYIIVIISFVFMLCSLLQLYSGFYTIGDRVLNDHVLCCSIIQKGERPFVPFDPVKVRLKFDFSNKYKVNQKTLVANIHSIPYRDKNITFLKGEFSKTGIVINQFVEEDIKKALNKENILNEKIDLIFDVGRKYNHIFSLPISGVIQEDESLFVANIYYPYEYVKSYLEQVSLNGGMNAYSLYKEYAHEYEAIYENNRDMHRIYNDVQDNHYSCQNNILEMKAFHQQQQELIRFILCILAIMMSIVIGVFICIYNYAKWKQQSSALMIIHSMGIPITIMKRYYIFINTLLFICLLMIACTLEIVLGPIVMNVMSSILSVFIDTRLNLWILLGVLCGYSFVYVLSQYMIMKHSAQKTIVEIMKEDNE